jgi:tripartite motif-containing protein 71
VLQHRLRSVALVLAATLVGVVGTAAVAPRVLAQPVVNPTPLSTLPTPFVSGHAGLYGWGAATMPDGSVIIGDYWNHDVLHYSAAGAYLGVMLTLAATPAVYSAPYGLAVDPTTKAIYVGFECCAVEKFSLSKKNVYLKPSRILHTGFKYPSRVAVGKDGTLYVADMTADTIFRFSNAGVYQGSWGSLGSGSNQFNGLTGIGLDQSTPQNLYVADPGNKRIDVINTSNGTFEPSFGGTNILKANLRGLAVDSVNHLVYIVDDTTGTIHEYSIPSGTYVQDIGAPWTLAQGNNGKACCAPPGQFANGGREATVDSLGHLWVGDMPDYRVQVFDASGNFVFAESGSPVGPANGGFDGPHGVAIDPNTGHLVISDTYNFRIQEFTSGGAWVWAQGMRDDVTTQYGLNYPMGVLVEPDGSFLVSDSYNQAIRKYDSSGNWVWTYTGKPGVQTLNHAQGIALGTDGTTIYVADYLKKRVVRLQDKGSSVIYLGTFGSGLKQPSGVAVDPATGNVFVSDFTGPDVVEFDSTGTELMTIGGPGTSQPLQNPADVVLDGNYLYVSDSKTSKVLVFDEATGSLVTSFGGLGSGAGQFSVPIGLALNGAGDLYIADSGNDRISEWCVTGC